MLETRPAVLEDELGRYEERIRSKMDERQESAYNMHIERLDQILQRPVLGSIDGIALATEVRDLIRSPGAVLHHNTHHITVGMFAQRLQELVKEEKVGKDEAVVWLHDVQRQARTKISTALAQAAKARRRAAEGRVAERRVKVPARAARA